MPVAGAFATDLPVFRQLRHTVAGRAWLAALPDVVRDLERRWSVSTAKPFREGTSSWVAPGVTTDGRPVVLKVAWPHREARGEHIGLRLWAGDGAPLLYAADPDRYALLVERCTPGKALSEGAGSVGDALIAAGNVLRQLWRPATAGPGLERLAAVCREWADLVRERSEQHRPHFDSGLVEEGAHLLETLPATAARNVVLHGDANPGNFLTAQRQPWLAIDAKPMTGDPAYDPWPLLCQLDSPFERPNPARELRRRYAFLADVVDVPADRMLAWSVARAVESAIWAVSEGDIAAANTDMAQARLLAAAADGAGTGRV